MTIFLDTANIEEIRKYMTWGIIRGVTTNQKIWLKEKGKVDKVGFDLRLKQILKEMKGYPVSIELTRTSDRYGDKVLVEEAKEYTDLGDNVVIKVPMWATGRGLRVGKLLLEEKVPVNMTCCISTQQAILACELGVKYVSFFYNRIIDHLKSKKFTKDEAVEQACITFIETREFIDIQGFNTKIIAGSIRRVEDIPDVLCNGAHIATVTPKIMKKLPFHPKTEETIKEFDQAWKKFQEG